MPKNNPLQKLFSKGSKDGSKRKKNGVKVGKDPTSLAVEFAPGEVPAGSRAAVENGLVCTVSQTAVNQTAVSQTALPATQDPAPPTGPSHSSSVQYPSHWQESSDEAPPSLSAFSLQGLSLSPSHSLQHSGTSTLQHLDLLNTSLNVSRILEECADSDISEISQRPIRDLDAEVHRLLEEGSSESEWETQSSDASLSSIQLEHRQKQFKQVRQSTEGLADDALYILRGPGEKVREMSQSTGSLESISDKDLALGRAPIQIHSRKLEASDKDMVIRIRGSLGRPYRQESDEESCGRPRPLSEELEEAAQEEVAASRGDRRRGYGDSPRLTPSICRQQAVFDSEDGNVGDVSSESGGDPSGPPPQELTLEMLAMSESEVSQKASSESDGATEGRPGSARPGEEELSAALEGGVAQEFTLEMLAMSESDISERVPSDSDSDRAWAGSSTKSRTAEPRRDEMRQAETEALEGGAAGVFTLEMLAMSDSEAGETLPGSGGERDMHEEPLDLEMLGWTESEAGGASSEGESEIVRTIIPRDPPQPEVVAEVMAVIPPVREQAAEEMPASTGGRMKAAAGVTIAPSEAAFCGGTTRGSEEQGNGKPEKTHRMISLVPSEEEVKVDPTAVVIQAPQSTALHDLSPELEVAVTDSDVSGGTLDEEPLRESPPLAEWEGYGGQREEEEDRDQRPEEQAGSGMAPLEPVKQDTGWRESQTKGETTLVTPGPGKDASVGEGGGSRNRGGSPAGEETAEQSPGGGEVPNPGVRSLQDTPASSTSSLAYTSSSHGDLVNLAGSTKEGAALTAHEGDNEAPSYPDTQAEVASEQVDAPDLVMTAGDSQTLTSIDQQITAGDRQALTNKRQGIDSLTRTSTDDSDGGSQTLTNKGEGIITGDSWTLVHTDGGRSHRDSQTLTSPVRADSHPPSYLSQPGEETAPRTRLEVQDLPGKLADLDRRHLELRVAFSRERAELLGMISRQARVIQALQRARKADHKKMEQYYRSLQRKLQEVEGGVLLIGRECAGLQGRVGLMEGGMGWRERRESAGEAEPVESHDPRQRHRKISLLSEHKVTKLKKFFGDNPPLLEQFLKRLGYEQYISKFLNERIGLLELPHVTEEQLVDLGIPLGPRLRIMHEASLL